MVHNNFFFFSARIFLEIAGDIIYFPIWWYSRGLIKVAGALQKFLVDEEKSLSLFVWIKNIFKPMYGQYNWQGHLISFFVRLIQIIIRGLIMLFFFIAALVIFCFWLSLPFLVIYEIIFQIFL